MDKDQDTKKKDKKRKEKDDQYKVEVEVKKTDAENNNRVDDESEKKSKGSEKPEENETASDEVKEKTPEQVIDDYKEKIKELDNRNLRLVADFDNYKKRTARQYEDIIRNSNSNVIGQILEVVDNFERALEAVSNSSDADALRTGAEMIYQQLLDILKKEGVEAISAEGEQFDPNLHEAMMQSESDEVPEGTIISEMTKGYMLNGKVIRYPKVVVSSGKSGKKDD